MTQQQQRSVHFDPLDPGLAQPYHRVSAQIRQECPVAFSDRHWSPDETGFWLVTGYPETDEIASDPRRFINGEGATPVQFDLDVMRLIPLENDEPMHKQMRLKLNPFFHRVGHRQGRGRRAAHHRRDPRQLPLAGPLRHDRGFRDHPAAAGLLRSCSFISSSKTCITSSKPSTSCGRSPSARPRLRRCCPSGVRSC